MRLLLFSISLQACFAYKFLVFSPLFGHSHTTFMAKIADTLSAAGHDVTFLVPIVDETIIGKKNVSITKDVIVLESDPRTREVIEESHRIMFRQFWEMSPDVFSLLKVAGNFTVAFKYTCDNVLSNTLLLEKLKMRKYDVGIAEPFSICGLALFEHINIPASIGALSVIQIELISISIGEPLAPSYVPSMSTATGDKMGFIDRLKNYIGTLAQLYFMHSTFTGESEPISRILGSSFTGYKNLLAKSSFIFTNSNPYLDYPRPLIHKTVQIGGITVDIKTPGKVDEKWDKILNKRKHNVFISFGSVAKSKDMPEAWKKSILEVCASLPDVTFIWKYEEKTTMADNILNLHLSPWLPQNALLGDKRLSIFVTHGGLGSTTEVAHLGKPAIMIPLFADQPRNADMLAKAGGAIALQKIDLAKPEKLRSAILKVLNDNSYALAAERLSEMLKEQPVSAQDLVVRHSEFVAKFGSIENLDPYGRHLNFIEYYCIDVIIVILSMFTIAILTFFMLSRWMYRRFVKPQKLKIQ